MLAHERSECRSERGAIRRRDLPERLEIDAVECADRPDDPRVYLRFRQRAGQRIDDRWAELEDLVGELEVEKRALPFLELRGGRKHVVGELRRLGHGGVDDDAEFERSSPLRAVGQGVHGLADSMSIPR